MGGQREDKTANGETGESKGGIKTGPHFARHDTRAWVANERKLRCVTQTLGLRVSWGAAKRVALYAVFFRAGAQMYLLPQPPAGLNSYHTSPEPRWSTATSSEGGRDIAFPCLSDCDVPKYSSSNRSRSEEAYRAGGRCGVITPVKQTGPWGVQDMLRNGTKCL